VSMLLCNDLHALSVANHLRFVLQNHRCLALLLLLTDDLLKMFRPEIEVLDLPVELLRTQRKPVVRVSCDPIFESVTKDGERIDDGACETLTIGSSASAPWFMGGESAAPTLELTQTAIRRVRGE
jgi:hypothetical protein